MNLYLVATFYLASAIPYLVWRFDRLVVYSFYSAPRKSQVWLVFAGSVVVIVALILVLRPVFLILNVRKPLN